VIADPVIADLIREDARQTLADYLARIDDIQASAYVDSRLEYYERNIGDMITDLAENDCDCVVDRLQWLLKNDKQFRQNVREFARITREKY
jgi:hypothetical protein